MKKYFLLQKKNNIIGICLQMLVSFGQVISAMSLAPILNSVVLKEFKTMLFYIGIALCLWIFTIIIDYISKVYQENTIRLMINQVRNDFSKVIMKEERTHHNQRETNSLISQMSNDVRLIEENGFKGIYRIVDNLGTIGFSFISLFTSGAQKTFYN